jgi:hypothetical protein
VTKYNIKGEEKMRDLIVVSEIKTPEEYKQMKDILEIFIVRDRIKELAITK